LFGRAAVNGEWRRFGIGKPFADTPDDVAAGGDVREIHLAYGIARGLANHDVAVGLTQLDDHARYTHTLQRDGYHDTSATRCRLRGRLARRNRAKRETNAIHRRPRGPS
jgi:hypothetical protein